MISILSRQNDILVTLVLNNKKQIRGFIFNPLLDHDACMNLLYIDFIGKSMKNTISYKSIAFEAATTVSQVSAIVYLSELSWCSD